MRKLWRIMHEYQENNVAEKGIKFSEEEFTQLFDETVKAGLEHIVELRTSKSKGMLIGAALTGLGVLGYNRFKKHKLKDKRFTIEELEKMGIKVSDVLTEEVGESEQPSDKKKRPKDTKAIAEELLDSYRKRI